MDDVIHCLNGITVNKTDIDLVEIISVIDRENHWSTYVYLYAKGWMHYGDDKIYNYINIFHSLKDSSKEYTEKQNRIESIEDSFKDYAKISMININVYDDRIKLYTSNNTIATIPIKDICKPIYLKVMLPLYKRGILQNILTKDEMDQFISYKTLMRSIDDYKEKYNLALLISRTLTVFKERA